MRHQIAVILLLIVPMSAGAQMSNAETIAGLSGRVLGAAKACGVDGNRLARTGEKVFAVVTVRAKSERDKGSAISLFTEAYNGGAAEVASKRTSCRQARAAFEDIETKFARY